MKNSILNLGKALNKEEQKEINGGSPWPWGTCKYSRSCQLRLNDPIAVCHNGMCIPS